MEVFSRLGRRSELGWEEEWVYSGNMLLMFYSPPNAAQMRFFSWAFSRRWRCPGAPVRSRAGWRRNWRL